MPRIVLLIDGDHVDILEAPEDLNIEVIPWGSFVDDPEYTDYGDAVDDLGKALDIGDLDSAIAITKSLTAEPPEYDEEDPRAWGGR